MMKIKYIYNPVSSNTLCISNTIRAKLALLQQISIYVFYPF